MYKCFIDSRYCRGWAVDGHLQPDKFVEWEQITQYNKFCFGPYLSKKIVLDLDYILTPLEHPVIHPQAAPQRQETSFKYLGKERGLVDVVGDFMEQYPPKAFYPTTRGWHLVYDYNGRQNNAAVDYTHIFNSGGLDVAYIFRFDIRNDGGLIHVGKHGISPEEYYQMISREGWYEAPAPVLQLISTQKQPRKRIKDAVKAATAEGTSNHDVFTGIKPTKAAQYLQRRTLDIFKRFGRYIRNHPGDLNREEWMGICSAVRLLVRDEDTAKELLKDWTTNHVENRDVRHQRIDTGKCYFGHSHEINTPKKALNYLRWWSKHPKNKAEEKYKNKMYYALTSILDTYESKFEFV